MDKKYLNALWRCDRMTGDRLRQAMSYFPDWETAWSADFGEWIKTGIQMDALEKICSSRREIDLGREWERLEELEIAVFWRGESAYPRLLKEINSPPELLYVKGEMLPEDEIALTVVGSRAVTQYGRRVTENIVGGVASRGVTIVSGLALGVDGEAHKAALKVGGRTIAVLANGLDMIYPVANTKIAKEILDGRGAVISEYPLGAEPLRQRFPARNRIVAGLGLGTLIIEAAAKSGSLITAQMALDSGREVMAVPGSIFSGQSEGTNNLFKEATAHAVTNADEILTLLNVNKKSDQAKFDKAMPENPIERNIWDVLGDEEMATDEIVKKAGLTAGEVASVLTLMEMRGLVRNLGGGRWGRN